MTRNSLTCQSAGSPPSNVGSTLRLSRPSLSSFVTCAVTSTEAVVSSAAYVALMIVSLSPGAGGGELTSVLIHCAVQSSGWRMPMVQVAGALQAEGVPSASHTRTFHSQRIRDSSGLPAYSTLTD